MVRESSICGWSRGVEEKSRKLLQVRLKSDADFANKFDRGAAQATSCRLELSFTEEMYDIRQNSVLRQEYEAVVQSDYHMGLNPMEGAIGGSTGIIILS